MPANPQPETGTVLSAEEIASIETDVRVGSVMDIRTFQRVFASHEAVRAKLAAAQADGRLLQQAVTAAEATVARLREENDRLSSGIDLCPQCDQTIRKGHAPDCPILAEQERMVREAARREAIDGVINTLKVWDATAGPMLMAWAFIRTLEGQRDAPPERDGKE